MSAPSSVGLSHRTAPVSVLERVAVGADDLRKTARRAAPAPRRSARCCCCRPATASRSTPTSRASTPASPRSRSVLARHAGHGRVATCPTTCTCTSPRPPPSTCSPSPSGLDSMVVGESQILGQLRAAYALGTEVGIGRHRAARPGPDRAARRQAGALRDRHRPRRRLDRVGRPRPAPRRCSAPLPGRRALIVGAGLDGRAGRRDAAPPRRHRHRRRQPLAPSAAERLAATLGGRAIVGWPTCRTRSPTPTC